jgi:Uri superfamily endonuclease
MQGIYTLIISVTKDISITVGALGTVILDKGLYCYVGSAQVSVENRIKRHLHKDKRKFWHIDYLLASDMTKVKSVFYKEGAKTEECKISKMLAQRGVPIRGFGSSDCRCDAHLVRIENYEFLRESMHEIAVGTIQRWSK